MFFMECRSNSRGRGSRSLEKGTCTYNDMTLTSEFNLRVTFTKMFFNPLLHFVVIDELLRIEGDRT